MVVVVPTEPDSGKMKRSQSWTGTVDIGYALSEDETSKPGSWSSLMHDGTIIFSPTQSSCRSLCRSSGSQSTSIIVHALACALRRR